MSSELFKVSGAGHFAIASTASTSDAANVEMVKLRNSNQLRMQRVIFEKTNRLGFLDI